MPTALILKAETAGASAAPPDALLFKLPRFGDAQAESGAPMRGGVFQQRPADRDQFMFSVYGERLRIL
jgi:hypothetical protein